MTQRPFHSLAQAVEAYYDELRAYVRRRTGCRAMAEDIVQETWLRASEAAGSVMPDNPRAYLYRMAGNLAIDHQRRQRARLRLIDSGQDDGNPSDSLDRVPSPDPAPDDVTAARQELAILAEAVRDLPEIERTTFLLYRGEGLTMRQVAERLNIPEKTVEKRIARAMLRCRSRLRAAGRSV